MTTNQEIEQQEGTTTWMYLDVKGIVTCGKGHALFTVDDALNLPWDQPELQVRADYAAVKAAAAGRVAGWYAPLTKSRLTHESVDALLEADTERMLPILKRHFPMFDKFPAPARQAMTDMMINLGPSFAPEWPRFSACILSDPPDWEGAAANCHRAPPVSEARNQMTAALFREAVNVRHVDQEAARDAGD